MANKDFNLNAREFNGFVIPQREDGFLDATAMAKARGKTLENWWRTQETLSSFNELTKQECAKKGTVFRCVEINSSVIARLTASVYEKRFPELVQVKRGSPEFGGGTWLHPELSLGLMQWLDLKMTKKDEEKLVQRKLAAKLNAKTEIPTLVGCIDILTDAEIIEVKAVKNWKSAIGQILCYGKYYPSHSKRIHLFGECETCYLLLIESHCDDYQITLTWEA